MKSSRRHQLHLWISEADYMFLVSLAERRELPISAIVRRVLGRLRESQDVQPANREGATRPATGEATIQAQGETRPLKQAGLKIART